MSRPPISLGAILHAIATGVAWAAMMAGLMAVLSYDDERANVGAVLVVGGSIAFGVLMLREDWP